MKQQSQLIYFSGMTVAMLLWGMAWTASKIAALHANPEVAAFWRYAISFVTLIPLLWFMKTPFKTDRRGAMLMIGAGLLSSLFNYLVFAGVMHGQAGYGGTLVTSMSPIITYILSIFIFGVSLRFNEGAALALGIAGALILMRVPFDGLGFLGLESIYFIEAALIWAMVTIISQRASLHVSPMLYTLVVFGVATVSNMIAALPYEPFDFWRYDWVFWVTIALIGIFAGTFSTALFFVSASKVGAHRTAVFMFIVPVGAILSSVVVYDEQIELSTLAGCLLAFSAVVLFNAKKRRKSHDL